MNESVKKCPENEALHWDGKLTKSWLGNCFGVLALIVSSLPCNKNGKVLRIQKMANASGNALAKATFNILENWILVDKAASWKFVTTSSNSVWKKDGAKLLQDLLQRITKVVNDDVE